MNHKNYRNWIIAALISLQSAIMAQEPPTRSAGQSLFNLADRNQNGSLDRNELQLLLNQIENRTLPNRSQEPVARQPRQVERSREERRLPANIPGRAESGRENEIEREQSPRGNERATDRPTGNRDQQPVPREGRTDEERIEGAERDDRFPPANPGRGWERGRQPGPPDRAVGVWDNERDYEAAKRNLELEYEREKRELELEYEARKRQLERDWEAYKRQQERTRDQDRGRNPQRPGNDR